MPWCKSNSRRPKLCSATSLKLQMKHDPVVNFQWGAPVRANPEPPLEAVAEQYKEGWMETFGVENDEEWEASSLHSNPRSFIQFCKLICKNGHARGGRATVERFRMKEDPSRSHFLEGSKPGSQNEKWVNTLDNFLPKREREHSSMCRSLACHPGCTFRYRFVQMMFR